MPEFYEYQTNYGQARKFFQQKLGEDMTVDEYYQATLRGLHANKYAPEYHQNILELQWTRAHRPYYNVYPGIIPCLTRLKLSIDSGLIKCPLPVVCIRLPVKQNPFEFKFQGEQYRVKNILLAQAGEKEVKIAIGGKSEVHVAASEGLSVWMDIGEYSPVGGVPGIVLTYRNFKTEPGKSVEQVLEDLPLLGSYGVGVEIPQKILDDVIRLCCTLCLLEDDPEIIEPDVLDADRMKFQQTKDPKFIDKALRRHKVGWNVGRTLQVSPHYRGPSPAALYWTGPGRAVPKIRFRRGTIVHREIVEKLPQGHEGDQG